MSVRGAVNIALVSLGCTLFTLVLSVALNLRASAHSQARDLASINAQLANVNAQKEMTKALNRSAAAQEALAKAIMAGK